MRVVVVGLGYIGLPLAVAIARAGVDAVGFDTDAARIGSIAAGRAATPGVDAAEVAALAKRGDLELGSEEKLLEGADVVVLAVPTPVFPDGAPDRTHLDAAVASVLRFARKGMLVVLESTSPPGTTREIAARFETAGFAVGTDLFVAHAPERIDPGNARFTLETTPRIVGGVTPACTERAVAFYIQFVPAVRAVTDADTAEVVKLFENTFRAVNIGLVNELARAGSGLGVDVNEVLDAAATKPFGFLKFTPGPGLGGPCIPAAARALAWKMKSVGADTSFEALAEHANRAMPAYVTRLVEEALGAAGKSIAGARILLCGMAYKPGVADVRGTPTLPIFDALTARESHVFYMDSFVPVVRHGGRTLESLRPDTSFAGFDAVVIVTAHPDLDVARLVGEAAIVVDTRNATAGHLSAASAAVVRL
ncbi:MAG TPA: nucleotide sugar dehydrogenase [Polyangiaceae bacterium]